ncbi:MAG: hypothetical protein NTV86_06160 [Planctomycetota bacterium]|nr:hypothetical protein [Planctomycetota bacterium]
MTRYPIAITALAAFLTAGCTAPSEAPSQSSYSLAADSRREPWTGKDVSGDHVVTAHYSIYLTTRQPYLREHVAGFMEAAHRNHLELSGLAEKPLPKPMDVYLMSTRNEWADLTQAHMGARSEPYMHIQAGGYMAEGVCVFWDIGALSTLRIASHEGLHQLFYHRLRQRLPVWLEEGLCTQAEGFQIRDAAVEFNPADNPDRFSSVREALTAGTWIPVRELLTMDVGQAVNGRIGSAVQYYGQLWALVLFLRSHPNTLDGVQQLLADAEAGQLHLAAGVSQALMTAQRTRQVNQAVSARLFEHYIAKDLDRFDLAYAAFARRLVRLP